MTKDAPRDLDQNLERISDLADQIYALAAPLDKRLRHSISDAAKLIQWLAYDATNPGDPDSAKAITTLHAALVSDPRPETRDD